MKKVVLAILLLVTLSSVIFAANVCCGKSKGYWTNWGDYYYDQQVESFLYDINNDVSADYKASSVFSGVSSLNISDVDSVFALSSNSSNDAKKQIMALFLNIAAGNVFVDQCAFTNLSVGTLSYDGQKTVGFLLGEVQRLYSSGDYVNAGLLAEYINTNCGELTTEEIPEFSPVMIIVSVVVAMTLFFIVRKRHQ